MTEATKASILNGFTKAAIHLEAARVHLEDCIAGGVPAKHVKPLVMMLSVIGSTVEQLSWDFED